MNKILQSHRCVAKIDERRRDMPIVSFEGTTEIFGSAKNNGMTDTEMLS
jgi:hypothetical protein